MKKILMIICCLMMSLGISAQKNFVYGIYDVQTKKGVVAISSTSRIRSSFLIVMAVNILTAEI